MERVDKLRTETKISNEDNNSTNDAISTNSIDNRSVVNVITEGESKNNSSQLQCQIAEEKAAAKIFPLNLISNRFKPKDPQALKGKLQLHAINLHIYVRSINFINKKINISILISLRQLKKFKCLFRYICIR